MRTRIRLKLTKTKQYRPTEDYFRLRYWWLHELRTFRAKRKAGTATIKDLKTAQRALARVRKDERVPL